MQYGHLPTLQERRDDNNATPFQPHQSISQALGTHLTHTQYRQDFRTLSTSPPTHPQPPPPASHSPLAFTNAVAPSPGLKRKHADSSGTTQQQQQQQQQHVIKRGRREIDDTGGGGAGDPYDLDPAGQGAKHWTDEEKSKLFQWLMGVGQDEHWNALRATKNSCLRECANDVFGSKKTYQALKGCYERNFNLFKQIYAFENFHAPNNNLSHLSEADRLREYERRLGAARKSGCDVGNITARTIEHWHRRGWYELFYRRWHGDPATTRPSQSRNNTNASNNTGVHQDDQDDNDDHPQQQQSQSQPSAPQQQQPPPPQQQSSQQQQPPPPHQQTNTQSGATNNSSTNNANNSATAQSSSAAASAGLDFTSDLGTGPLTNGTLNVNGFTPHLNYINPQSLRDNPLVPPSPATVPVNAGPSSSSSMHPAGMGGGLGGTSSLQNGNVTAGSHSHFGALGPGGGGGGGGGSGGAHTALGGGGGGGGGGVSGPAGLGGPFGGAPLSAGGSSMPSSSTPMTATGSGSNPNSSSGGGNPSNSSGSGSGGGVGGGSTSSSTGTGGDPPVVNISITQSMISTYLQFLQVQTQTGKMKLEYLRRREEREEKESAQRREMERMKLEREAAEFEHSKHSANTKQKADRAIELLSNPSIDASVKHAASEFLKKLFASD